MRPISITLLVCLGLMVLLPAAAIAPAPGHAAPGVVLIGSLDVCHGAAPDAAAGMPYSIHECPCTPVPFLRTDAQRVPRISFKPLLIASRDERPPQA